MLPRFQPSFETRILIDALSNLTAGEVLTYGELSALVGTRIAGASPSLQSARRHLENAGTATFSIVTKIGIKRLSDADIVAAADADRLRVRNAAKRGLRRVSNVASYDALDDASKRRHNAHAAVFGMIEAATSEKRLKEIEALSPAESRRLAMRESLGL